MNRRPIFIDRRAFVDTSAYYALADEDDANHARARRIVATLISERWHLITTNFVVAETHTLILNRLGRRAALKALADIRGSAATRVVRLRLADEQRAEEIIRRYTDKQYSYIDASSFAVMERLGLTRAFAFDSDFAQYGFVMLTPP